MKHLYSSSFSSSLIRLPVSIPVSFLPTFLPYLPQLCFVALGCTKKLSLSCHVSNSPPLCSLSSLTIHMMSLFLLLLQGKGHGWSVPVLPMMMSVPLWAIIVTQMCSNWAYYTLLTSLPTYMDNILHFDLQSVRFNSRWKTQQMFGTFSDILQTSAQRFRMFSLKSVSLPAERLSVRSAVPRRHDLLHSLWFCSRQAHREESVQRHCRTQALHPHRQVN